MSAWPTWGCEASKFPWSYSENETCYVLEGRVIVTPDGEGLVLSLNSHTACVRVRGKQARQTLSRRVRLATITKLVAQTAAVWMPFEQGRNTSACCCAAAGGEGVEIKAGDMATFPAGMSCT